MKWRVAAFDEVPRLAAMNRRLIEDEGHRNRMTLEQLGERMEGFLRGEYTAILFLEATEVVGYALLRPVDGGIRIRQFFIERDRRRRGLGRAAVRALLEEVVPAGRRIELEVLETNPEGLAFWRGVGFSDYCRTLEFRRG